MATLKKRINISVTKDVEDALTDLAKRDQKPRATKAGELIRLALELEEEYVLDAIASSRDTKKARFVSHKDAWA
jgi:hypothetical protein